MPVQWKEYIISTPDVLHGTPRLKDTRIPVRVILGDLAAGSTTPQIIAEFPDLCHKDIAACLDYARDLADFEVAA